MKQEPKGKYRGHDQQTRANSVGNLIKNVLEAILKLWGRNTDLTKATDHAKTRIEADPSHDRDACQSKRTHNRV